MQLTSPVSVLSGITKKQRDALAVLKIETIKDLIFYFPYRYEDFSYCASIADLKNGTHATIEAKIIKAVSRRGFRRFRSATEIKCADGTGEITIVFYNQPYLAKNFKKDERFRFAGKAFLTKKGIQLINPVYEPIIEESGGMNPFLPVYSLSAGLTQFAIRKYIAKVADYINDIQDTLPESIRETYNLFDIRNAVHKAHFPDSAQDWKNARRRILFDEMVKFQASLEKARILRRSNQAVVIPFHEKITRSFTQSLSFSLTDDQRKAAWVTLQDMGKQIPMYRLLNGDVGSGKTVVAAIAIMQAAQSGYQVAFMAPTEILARQHFETLKQIFRTQNLSIALWTNTQKRSITQGEELICEAKRECEALQSEIREGRISVIVGTHALVMEKFQFGNLALAVIDEQHRFGVRMRQAIVEKGANGTHPHLLSMTATPIPRSLALTAFGDLDVSFLREKPKNQKTIKSEIILPFERKRAYEHVRHEVTAGRQAFIVCPLIDENDTFGSVSAKKMFEELSRGDLFGISLGLLHGKMSGDEKEKVMNDFTNGRISVLVATSVVEVGVNIPNATVMCIEGAERFGFAQLHQFRGRVGRGEYQSYCYFLPSSDNTESLARLQDVAQTEDGFTLAEKDLLMRGPGDLLGVAQSGKMSPFFAAAFLDIKLIAEAKEAAKIMLQNEALYSDFFAPAIQKAEMAHGE